MKQQKLMVLIDEKPSAHDGIATLLRAVPGFHVLAVSATMEEARKQVREIGPDLVLLNLRLESRDCLLLSGALHGQAPRARVIILGLKAVQGDVASFIRAGVSGFVMVDAPFTTFLSTIHSVADGIQVLPVELTRVLFGQLKDLGVTGRPKKALDVGRVTNQKRAATDLIVQGLSNKQIAARLRIALRTAETLVHDGLAKLSGNGRLEVAALAWSGTIPALMPAFSLTGSAPRAWLSSGRAGGSGGETIEAAVQMVLPNAG
jgi:DNA-binding NarL/FixJ family response regulator